MMEMNQIQFWITDDILIRKANTIASNYRLQTGIEFQFQSGPGWLRNFKRRFKINSVNLHGEAAQVPLADVAAFQAQLQHIIQLEGYCPEQLFNVDETGLWFKKKPRRTLAAASNRKLAGDKDNKQRVTLLLGMTIQFCNYNLFSNSSFDSIRCFRNG